MRKDSGAFGSVQRPKKQAQVDGPLRNEASVASNVIPHYADCGRRHPSECYRKSRDCLHCGSMEHWVRDCPHRLDQVPAPTPVTTASTIQPPKGSRQPPRGSGTGRGGSSSGRGQRVLDRGTTQTEAC